MCSGVLTQPSDTVIQLSLTRPPASTILEPPYLASPQVSYFVTRDSKIICTVILTYISDAYNLYVKATGAVFDENTGLLMINLTQYENLQSLYFVIENRTYEFNANAQVWPRALNQVIGGNLDFAYLIVSDLGPDQDMGFVAGMTFLQRFYVVFDSRRHRVGLANTQYTNSTEIN
jgi:hypothetical protein